MIFTLIQIAAFVALAAYLRHWRADLRRRNAQSWDSLLARLRPDWIARETCRTFLSNEGLNATPEEKWERMNGARGLWAMHQNARVMLEMADYAARNSDSVDPALLSALRSDAMLIRCLVLRALAQYAVSQVNESICVNAFRAVSTYTEMAARTAQLLTMDPAGMLPAPLSAM